MAASKIYVGIPIIIYISDSNSPTVISIDITINVRVNTVNPAPIETRMMRSLEEMRVAAADSSEVTVEQTKQATAARIPLQRYGNPEEVAKLMLFL
ncbi:MAG: SDR family oxidoreductase, partial [Bacteroidetes bacterium]|nr:SDR family oxidoreductase [Bacteroidota bacterium]